MNTHSTTTVTAAIIFIQDSALRFVPLMPEGFVIVVIGFSI
jgi:hypothetical protein